MRIEFDNLEAFLDEIKAELADTEVSHCVRVTAETQDVNNGVTQVFLKAGFLPNDTLRELRLYCGEDWAGGGADGSREFKQLLDQLDTACAKMKVTVRGGVYRG